MAVSNDFYKQIYLKVDFGLNANQQIVQKEIPELVQHDNNSGLLIFDFYNNGRKIDMASCRVVVNFKLPSGIGFHDEISNIRPIESRAMYFAPMVILSEVGTVIGDVAIYSENIQITSNAKFQFNVIEGIGTGDIVNSEKYPILLSLINQVDGVVGNARVWEQEFNNKYVEVTQEINAAKAQFSTQNGLFKQEFDSKMSLQDQHFSNKSEALDVRFNEKYKEVDTLFNQGNINAMFEEKFVRLEQDYAQDYTDMKQTVKEVYGTTLKYRIVE